VCAFLIKQITIIIIYSPWFIDFAQALQSLLLIRTVAFKDVYPKKRRSKFKMQIAVINGRIFLGILMISVSNIVGISN